MTRYFKCPFCEAVEKTNAPVIDCLCGLHYHLDEYSECEVTKDDWLKWEYKCLCGNDPDITFEEWLEFYGEPD